MTVILYMCVLLSNGHAATSQPIHMPSNNTCMRAGRTAADRATLKNIGLAYSCVTFGSINTYNRGTQR